MSGLLPDGVPGRPAGELVRLVEHPPRIEWLRHDDTGALVSRWWERRCPWCLHVLYSIDPVMTYAHFCVRADVWHYVLWGAEAPVADVLDVATGLPAYQSDAGS